MIKLKEIFLQLQEVIETYLPTEMAIEAPFYGKNVQSMLKLGRAQGVAMAAAMTMGLNIHEYSPKKIKQAISVMAGYLTGGRAHSRTRALRTGGALRDVGPTILALLGIDQPSEMTGRDLREG